MEKQTFDVPDLEVLTGLGKSTLYELDRKGEIPGRLKNVGRRKLFSRARIMEWLEGRPDGPGGD